MSKQDKKDVVSYDAIQGMIFIIRGKKVMVDQDLARLYGVPTKSLNLAVKRNVNRFPDDFMFRLTPKEEESLRFHFETSKKGRGGRRYLPYVFTQEGVAMLSGVLNSERAVYVNIQIMRTFVKLRELIVSNDELRNKIEKMEQKYDGQFQVVFKALKALLDEPVTKKKGIGFHAT